MFEGRQYKFGDLVDMPESLVNHLFETSVVEKFIPKQVPQIFAAIINGSEVSDEVRDALRLREGEDRIYFNLMVSHEGEEKRDTQFSINKDKAMQVINLATE